MGTKPFRGDLPGVRAGGENAYTKWRTRVLFRGVKTSC